MYVCMHVRAWIQRSTERDGDAAKKSGRDVGVSTVAQKVDTCCSFSVHIAVNTGCMHARIYTHIYIYMSRCIYTPSPTAPSIQPANSTNPNRRCFTSRKINVEDPSRRTDTWEVIVNQYMSVECTCLTYNMYICTKVCIEFVICLHTQPLHPSIRPSVHP